MLYLTYEELKHFSVFILFLNNKLYLTYEELKLYETSIAAYSLLYLTYEELKRVHSFHKKHFVCMLHCTLPMRN